MLTQAPKGTKDVTPRQSAHWHAVEGVMRRVCDLAGYREIRTPAFEHTELFMRGVGETTDVVQKEMYTFEDKGGRSITLKPEGTAGAVRAYLEHGMANDPQPMKMYYMYSPVFRYEKPQSGRFREHHQFGLEVFGAKSATVDAEVIDVAMSVFRNLGITKLALTVNSIGCPECRKTYNQALKAFLEPLMPQMCPTCGTRYEKNPMRILDCKDPSCQALTKDAPTTFDRLCGDCAAHFADLEKLLRAMGIGYTIDKRLVRGLDYYTRTVFEIIGQFSTGPLTVCAGGRYDGLVEQLGGAPTPGVGFGMGMERLIMAMEQEGLLAQDQPLVDVFVASMGATNEAFQIARELRAAGVRTDCDHAARSLKAQFKYAGKTGAAIVLVLGEDELREGTVTMRDMRASSEKRVPRSDIAATVRAAL